MPSGGTGVRLSQSGRSLVWTQVIALVEPQTTKWRLRRGLSAEEVAELFDELGAPLLSWFRREVKTRDEAADLWSETWARVVASRSKIRGSTRAEHAGFVYTIARNLLADWRRRGVIEQRALQRLGIEPLRMDDEFGDLDDPGRSSISKAYRRTSARPSGSGCSRSSTMTRSPNGPDRPSPRSANACREG